MKRMIATLLLIALMMLTASAYVILSAWFWNKAQNEDIGRRASAYQSLPEKCSPYYGDGSGRWPECMGVGYK